MSQEITVVEIIEGYRGALTGENYVEPGSVLECDPEAAEYLIEIGKAKPSREDATYRLVSGEGLQVDGEPYASEPPEGGVSAAGAPSREHQLLKKNNDELRAILAGLGKDPNWWASMNKKAMVKEILSLEAGVSAETAASAEGEPTETPPAA
ncbi:MAG: hypothetical protein KF821_09040 [Anaerolineales bacterium]|nr:hypothetical protein [Anaerolineales bacterium]